MRDALQFLWTFLKQIYRTWRDNDLTWKLGVLSYTTALSLLPFVLVLCWLTGAILDAVVPNWIDTVVEHGVPYFIPQLELLGRQGLEGAAGLSNLPTKPEVVGQIKSVLRAATSRRFGGTALAAFAVFGFFFVLAINRTMNDLWGPEARPSEHPVYRFLYVLLCVVLLVAAGLLVPALHSALSTFGGGIKSWVQSWLGTLMPPVVLWVVLVAFYAAAPAPHVRYRACFVGGLVGTIALQINESLASLYVYGVISAGYLYGVMSVTILALTGLYVFWFCVMLGAVTARVLDRRLA